MSETEAVVRIQSQAGVEEFGQLVFGYSSATEKLDVEYVRVRKPDGQVVMTPESTAQHFAPGHIRRPTSRSPRSIRKPDGRILRRAAGSESEQRPRSRSLLFHR